MFFRLPQLAHVLGSKRIQRDHVRRLLVQEHEAERTLYKAMTHDQTLPLDIRLQVRWSARKGRGSGLGKREQEDGRDRTDVCSNISALTSSVRAMGEFCLC